MDKELNDVTNQQLQRDRDKISDNPAPAPAGPTDQQADQPVSAKKIEANRINARKSTGPRSQSGKAKSAGNAFKHGFFARALFPATSTLKDHQDYLDLVSELHAHYQPVGFLEELCVEKIATEMLRLRRILSHEQWLITGDPSKYVFEARSLDRTLRYQTALSRQLDKAMEKLDQLQANQTPDVVPAGLHEPETKDTTAEVEPPTLSNPEVDDAPADDGIEEPDPTLVVHEESSASNSSGAAQIEK